MLGDPTHFSHILYCFVFEVARIGVANTGFLSPYWRCQYGLFVALLALPIRALCRPIGVANTGFLSPYWRCQYGLFVALLALPIRA